jgi:hypothetical protein
MAFNLLKKYNQLLDIGSFGEHQRTESLYGVFYRDIVTNKSFSFRLKAIKPTPVDGAIKLGLLFKHLTTEVVDHDTKRREFERHRSIRLHWIKFHIEERKKENVLVFSVKEPEGIRTYIYDEVEKYVVVLEPLRQNEEYYLLSAYHIRGKDLKRDKFKSKYKRRLLELH